MHAWPAQTGVAPAGAMQVRQLGPQCATSSGTHWPPQIAPGHTQELPLGKKAFWQVKPQASTLRSQEGTALAGALAQAWQVAPQWSTSSATH